VNSRLSSIALSPFAQIRASCQYVAASLSLGGRFLERKSLSAMKKRSGHPFSDRVLSLLSPALNHPNRGCKALIGGLKPQLVFALDHQSNPEDATMLVNPMCARNLQVRRA
jgi:hypothetical protein